MYVEICQVTNQPPLFPIKFATHGRSVLLPLKGRIYTCVRKCYVKIQSVITRKTLLQLSKRSYIN